MQAMRGVLSMTLKDEMKINPTEFIKRYDDESRKYITEYLLPNDTILFKNYCTCGAVHNDLVRHAGHCLQGQEVQEWIDRQKCGEFYI